MPATNRPEGGRRGASDRVTARRLVLFRARRRRVDAPPLDDLSIPEGASDLPLQAFWRNRRRQDLEDAHRLGARPGREPVPPAAGDGGSTTAQRPADPEEVRHAGPL